MVADLFNKNERPRALGVFAIGTYLGVFLGYFIGGWVNQHYGWRMAFFTAGLPGIALAAVALSTTAFFAAAPAEASQVGAIFACYACTTNTGDAATAQQRRVA